MSHNHKYANIPFGEGESDPDGIDQHAPGAKTDKGKPDCSLLLYFGKALTAVSEVGTFGAEKYTRGGWQTVADGINRYTAAMLRHVLQENYEEYDRDLPVMHAAQVAWNALARLELMLRGKSEVPSYEEWSKRLELFNQQIVGGIDNEEVPDDSGPCNVPNCESTTRRCGSGCDNLTEERPIHTTDNQLKRE
jgi:hypothetical protein